MAEGTRGSGCSRWFLLQEGPCPEAELDPASPGPRRRAMPSPGPGVPAEGFVCNPGGCEHGGHQTWRQGHSTDSKTLLPRHRLSTPCGEANPEDANTADSLVVK